MDEQNKVDPTANPSADKAAETVLPFGSRMGDVKAETVVIRQGAAQTIQASKVNVRQGATVQLKAEQAEVVIGRHRRDRTHCDRQVLDGWAAVCAQGRR